jgi:hypothetical protein
MIWTMAALFVGSLSLAVVEEANANNRAPGANKRMKNQKRRIKQGVRSGELTKDEAKELRQGHGELRKEIRDAKKDGVVTKEERKDIHKDLNAESKKIYQEKHDADKREKAKGGSAGGTTDSSTAGSTGAATNP